MIRGLYTATTGMVVQQIKQEVISNNLANVETPGFKREEVTTKPFPQVMLEWQSVDAALKPIRENMGEITLGTMVDEMVSIFEPGVVEETGNPLDISLLGDGFLTVETDQGRRYSRNGSLRVDAGGYLATPDGDYIMGSNGRIRVGSGEVIIDAAGRVRAGSEDVGTLAVVSFADPSKLQKTGDNLWEAPADLLPQPVTTRIKQGSLEKANVNLVTELVNMLAVTRAYEANQKMIQAQDEMLGKSVNELGSIIK
ncbi:MAG: flagellar hook-basal body protein [Bacillota bacterium]